MTASHYGTRISALFALALLACGGKAPAHQHPEPLSVSEHRTQAQEHDDAALAAEQRVGESPAGQAGEKVVCVDTGGPLSSGGERTKVMRPCWTQVNRETALHKIAEQERKAAADHRAWANMLIEVEQSACESLGEQERKTSPFTHQPDILSVEEYRESGALRGAKVVFRKVPGLTKEWIATSFYCHQARAAKLGYDSEFMPHCPLSLENTSTNVEDQNDVIVVTLRSEDPVIAASILGRAQKAATP